MDDQALSLVAAAVAAAVLVAGALLGARRLRRGRTRTVPTPTSPGAAARMTTSMPVATAPFPHPDVEPATPGHGEGIVGPAGTPTPGNGTPVAVSGAPAPAADGTVTEGVTGTHPPAPAATDGPAASPPSAPSIGPRSTPPLLRRDEWARAFAIEERRLARYRRPCAVVTVALDGFDALSLRIGADAAERLIGPLAASLGGRARTTDLVCRIDRTRFAALLPETDEAGAAAYAERVREACQQWLSASPVAVRLSIGWASPTSSGTLASALVDAERRMGVDRSRPTDVAPPAPGQPSGGYLARIAGSRARPEGAASD